MQEKLLAVFACETRPVEIGRACFYRLYDLFRPLLSIVGQYLIKIQRQIDRNCIFFFTAMGVTSCAVATNTYLKLALNDSREDMSPSKLVCTPE